MLIDIILVIFALIGFGILAFFLSCAYKQYRGSLSPEYVELFPIGDMYIKNAYEDEQINMSTEK